MSDGIGDNPVMEEKNTIKEKFIRSLYFVSPEYRNGMEGNEDLDDPNDKLAGTARDCLVSGERSSTGSPKHKYFAGLICCDGSTLCELSELKVALESNMYQRVFRIKYFPAVTILGSKFGAIEGVRSSVFTETLTTILEEHGYEMVENNHNHIIKSSIKPDFVENFF